MENFLHMDTYRFYWVKPAMHCAIDMKVIMRIPKKNEPNM
jgi:hypothetical protein